MRRCSGTERCTGFDLGIYVTEFSLFRLVLSLFTCEGFLTSYASRTDDKMVSLPLRSAFSLIIRRKDIRVCVCLSLSSCISSKLLTVVEPERENLLVVQLFRTFLAFQEILSLNYLA
jgi:hypothetical protein